MLSTRLHHALNQWRHALPFQCPSLSISFPVTQCVNTLAEQVNGPALKVLRTKPWYTKRPPIVHSLNGHAGLCSGSVTFSLSTSGYWNRYLVFTQHLQPWWKRLQPQTTWVNSLCYIHLAEKGGATVVSLQLSEVTKCTCTLAESGWNCNQHGANSSLHFWESKGVLSFPCYLWDLYNSRTTLLGVSTLHVHPIIRKCVRLHPTWETLLQ